MDVSSQEGGMRQSSRCANEEKIQVLEGKRKRARMRLDSVGHEIEA